MLSLAAAVEAESDHPIAVAITAAARPVTATVRHRTSAPCPASGVAGTVDGHRVEVSRLVPARLPASLRPAVAERYDRGETRGDGRARR